MSILRRDVYYTTKHGHVRFCDWATVTTTLGTCREPFCMNDRGLPNTDRGDFDASDIMVKVDNLVRCDGEEALIMKWDRCNGGTLEPRVFARAGNNRGST